MVLYLFVFALDVCPCSGLDGDPAGHTRGRDPSRARGPREDQETVPEEEDQAGGGLPRVPAGLTPQILMMKSTTENAHDDFNWLIMGALNYALLGEMYHYVWILYF